MHIGREDVNDFWQQQGWGLDLSSNGALSNCVYCFLKGIGNLTQVHEAMENQKESEIKDFGPTINTPCSIDWWASMEQKYGRDLELENRERTNPNAADFIGFFGASSEFSYDILADSSKTGEDLSRFADTVLPCDCTE